MDLGIVDRVAIVGGASRGLGKACADRLALEGASLTLCARNAGDLEAAARDIRETSGRPVLAVQADWSRPEDIRRTVSETLTHYGRIDILVQNTGGPPPGGFFDHPDEHWQAAFDLLLFSAVRMYREVIPPMRRNRWGRIINIASVTVKEPWENLILSNVFRTGVVSLAKSLSRELAKDHIMINTVCPGLYRTRRMEEVLRKQAESAGSTLEDMIARSTGDIPLGRMGDPAELADLVAFLASDLAGNITGTTIPADGGMVKGLM